MTRPPASPQPDRPETPSRSARRGFLLGGVAVLGAGGLMASRWFNVTGTTEGDTALTVTEAFSRAETGAITLIDIRRPDEWARTGVPQGGVALDMRRADFTDALLAQVNGDKASPIALICARGVRSRGMSTRLAQAGFTRIIDVPEGMLGSGAGPGWIKQGLPVVAAPKT